MIDMSISGPSIRDHRQQLGLSQAKLSELTGVPQHVLSAAERGKSKLSADMAAVVSDALRRTPEVKALSSRAKR